MRPTEPERAENLARVWMAPPSSPRMSVMLNAVLPSQALGMVLTVGNGL